MIIRFRKEKLTIDLIGKKRFWLGILAGLISAIFLSTFIDYSREVMKIVSSLSEDLMILPENQLVFFDYFFASFSTVFGFGLTLWIWLSNPRNKRKKDRVYKRLAQTNVLLTIWIFLALIARFGTILPIILYGMPGYDNHLDLYSDFWLLFVLIPLVIFLNNWHIIRLVYKSGKWILFSFLSVILCTVILTNFKTVNRDLISDLYHKSYSEEYQYIESEIDKVKSLDIVFFEQTVKQLKQRNTESSKNQVELVQNAFAKKRKVSLDTLILEKIIVHNFKTKIFYFFGRNEKDKNWSYAYPEQIYEQIKMYQNDCIEIQCLFEILREMILPLKAAEPDWENYDKYSKYEMRQFNQKRFFKYSTNTIIDRLVQVENRLRDNFRYEKYHNLLPYIDTTMINKSRWKTSIILNLDSIDNIYNK